MEKLPICRICLVHNVRMYIVVNRNLHELYEKLTNIPFVTEDIRPILACFVCCTKLKQCYQLLTKCLESEDQFATMMKEDYETNLLLHQDRLELYSGFIKSPIQHISIGDECQTESIYITLKEELPTVCEELDDIIEPKEENQSDELKPENLHQSCLVKVDLPPQHSESDSEDDVPLMELKTEVVEEEEVSKEKQRARETKRATVAKKRKLDSQRTTLEYGTTRKQTTKEKPAQRKTSKPGTYFKDSQRTQMGDKPKCYVYQRSFSHKSNLTENIRIQSSEKHFKCKVCKYSFRNNSELTKHIRIHTGEKPYRCEICHRNFSQKTHLTSHIRIHTGEKPYKCNVCQRRFTVKGQLTKHFRIHTGEKPHTCDICDRSFCQKGDLTRHFLIHTGEKPFKCNICERNFSVKFRLSRHIRIHTGEKPYKCDVCQRSFRRRSPLTKHIRIHTGEKPV